MLLLRVNEQIDFCCELRKRKSEFVWKEVKLQAEAERRRTRLRLFCFKAKRTDWRGERKNQSDFYSTIFILFYFFKVKEIFVLFLIIFSRDEGRRTRGIRRGGCWDTQVGQQPEIIEKEAMRPHGWLSGGRKDRVELLGEGRGSWDSVTQNPHRLYPAATRRQHAFQFKPQHWPSPLSDEGLNSSKHFQPGWIYFNTFFNVCLLRWINIWNQKKMSYVYWIVFTKTCLRFKDASDSH